MRLKLKAWNWKFWNFSESSLTFTLSRKSTASWLNPTEICTALCYVFIKYSQSIFKLNSGKFLNLHFQALIVILGKIIKMITWAKSRILTNWPYMIFASFLKMAIIKEIVVDNHIKVELVTWGASFWWLIGPNSAWESIETTTIGKTHPTL